MSKKPQAEVAENGDYMRRKAASRYAHVSLRTISDWQARRVIPFLKVSRKCVLFRKSDIDAALSRYEIKAI